MILFFDCETSDQWNFKSTIEDECQPRLVQIGALVLDENAKEVSSFNAIANPDGWFISDATAAIHGISQDRAERCGIPSVVIMAVLSNIARLCDTRVAFNIDFDDKILSREFFMLGRKNMISEITKPFCMMKAMTAVCKIPKLESQRFYNKSDPYKWPKLQEAYQFAFHKEFSGAHDAMADIRATAELYFWLHSKPEKEPNLI